MPVIIPRTNVASQPSEFAFFREKAYKISITASIPKDKPANSHINFSAKEILANKETPTAIIKTLRIKYSHQNLFSFLPIMHETTLQAPAKSKNKPVTFDIAPNADKGNEQKLPPAIKAIIPNTK